MQNPRSCAGGTRVDVDFANDANKKFVSAFVAKHNRMPTYYASQSYDTALAIGAALKQTKGDLNAAAFRTAMLKADFASVRGAFKFGPNQHPVQDWYALKVEKNAAGQPEIKTQRKVLTAHGDVYAAQCKI